MIWTNGLFRDGTFCVGVPAGEEERGSRDSWGGAAFGKRLTGAEREEGFFLFIFSSNPYVSPFLFFPGHLLWTNGWVKFRGSGLFIADLEVSPVIGGHTYAHRNRSPGLETIAEELPLFVFLLLRFCYNDLHRSCSSF
ncbi:hypothetical protein AVEN_172312-1 [Araneus ventricosus]|uniref:Uncharacterized protein n=1 Tax=Araneus ventricosus TaxID=182803 RepID=A0A4Y2E1L5_ARAVE|nr:hypothetical protein AVEN_172312-1 [Araneus ventricosus]